MINNLLVIRAQQTQRCLLNPQSLPKSVSIPCSILTWHFLNTIWTIYKKQIFDFQPEFKKLEMKYKKWHGIAIRILMTDPELFFIVAWIISALLIVVG